MLDLLNDNPDLLTVREVLTLLQVDPSTVYPLRARLAGAPDVPQNRGLTADAGRCLIDPARSPRLPRRAYTGR